VCVFFCIHFSLSIPSDTVNSDIQSGVKGQVGDFLKTPTFQIHDQSIAQVNIKTYYSKQEMVDDIKQECEEIESPQKNETTNHDVVNKTVDNIKLEDDNIKSMPKYIKTISKDVAKEDTGNSDLFEFLKFLQSS
jgi:hypothetical protein